MLLEETSTFPAVWGQGYGGEGNSSWKHASPRSIINRCIMRKGRAGRQPLDSFVSLVKSPSSWAPKGRLRRFEAETSCQGNGNISRCKSSGCQRNPNERGLMGSTQDCLEGVGTETKGNSGGQEPDPDPSQCQLFLYWCLVLMEGQAVSPKLLPALGMMIVMMSGIHCPWHNP